MQTNNHTPSSRVHQICTVFAMLCLLWLAVSTPFVNSYQQEIKKELQQSTDDNTINGNTTEEKNESGTSSLSEYLHQWVATENPFTNLIGAFCFYASPAYPPFHPETIAPPPDRRA